MNEIKPLVRGIYDVQDIRIRIGNRIVSHFMSKLGVKPGEKKSKDVDALWKELKQSHKRITDALLEQPKVRKKFITDGLIHSEIEYILVTIYLDLIEKEKQLIKALDKYLKDHPVYQWLQEQKGVGPLMAGVILSEIKIHKAKYVSSLWKYAGLDVVNGKARSARREHLVEREYIDKNGEKKTKLSLSFNKFLHDKLLGVLGTNLLRAKDEWATVYYNYRNRIENHPKHKDKSKGHIHNMSRRYMVKQFMKPLYAVWRQAEGLEVHPSYEEAKLGIKHHEEKAQPK